ncbi:hypothetical protein EI94DRAFT_1702058 [Lactarius quietus]|nr:hypothetical protein EI94DRAFT_1702058 [Lactarius quietus]
MSAPDVLLAPNTFEGNFPSPSGSRATHTRQMSSLSMTTFATSQSYYPSEPLLRNADHQGAHTRQPPIHDTYAEDRRHWVMTSARRMRRWRLFKGVLMSIIGSWASYTTIRYIIAYVVYSDRTPVNLALIFAWRSTRSEFSLRGRCHWDLDVVWVGVGGQCALHAPVWGVWLAAAVSRFVLTVIILITYHLASRAYRASRWLHFCAEDGQRRDNVDITRMAHGDTPSRPSPVLRPFIQKSGELPSVPQPSFSNGRMAVIPEFNEVRNQIPQHEHEYAGLDYVDSSTLSEVDSPPRSVESSTPPSKSLRHTKSLRELNAGEASSSRHAALASNVSEGELEGFADRFRAIVDRVSRELEEARTWSKTLRHEPIPMFGGVIRRMPTIESVGSRELASLRSTTLVSGVTGAPSLAPSTPASSRPPTRGTMVSFNDAASASLASVSATSSRSNSIHRPRMPSELGELVRDALRARGQPRSTPARPGSGGSAGSCVESARSRSNSQCASEVLAPVTEHGEHEDAPRARAPRRLCNTPEMLSAAGASELGELVAARQCATRTERSRSLGSSSSPSRSGTATTFFTAGTGSSGETGASGGGGGGSAPR